MKSSIDASIPPTYDFYMHVNNGWLKVNAPAAQELGGPFRDARMLAERRLDAVIAAEPPGGSLRTLYESYLAAGGDIRSAFTARALDTEFAACKHIGRGERMGSELAALQRAGVVAALELTITYARDAAMWLPKIKLSTHWRVDHETPIQLLTAQCGISEDELVTAKEFEAALSATIAHPGDRVDDESPHLTTLPASALPTLCPEFPWSDWLSGLGVSDERQRVVVAEPGAVAEVAEFFAHADVVSIASWLRVRVVSARWRVLSVGAGRDGARRVAEYYFSDRLARQYAAQFASPLALADAVDTGAELKMSLNALIAESQWCSPVGRAKAIARVADIAISVSAADPVAPLDDTSLRRDDVLGNLRKASELLWRGELARLGRGRETEIVSSETYSANGWYDQSMNRLRIGLGLLEPPFIEPGRSDAQFFGTLGVIIAHEIAHCLDLSTWDMWSDSDRDALRSRAERLIEQCTSGVFDPQAHRRIGLRPDSVLNETICDSVGLAVAEHALRCRSGERPTYSAMREFFVAWAWTMRATPAHECPDDASHAPARERCNWALRNNFAYHWAFGTAPGDPMWLTPESRVTWWG